MVNNNKLLDSGVYISIRHFSSGITEAAIIENKMITMQLYVNTDSPLEIVNNNTYSSSNTVDNFAETVARHLHWAAPIPILFNGEYHDIHIYHDGSVNYDDDVNTKEDRSFFDSIGALVKQGLDTLSNDILVLS